MLQHRRSPGFMALQKFLAYIVIFCLRIGVPTKERYCCSPEAKQFSPAKFCCPSNIWADYGSTELSLFDEIWGFQTRVAKSEYSNTVLLDHRSISKLSNLSSWNCQVKARRIKSVYHFVRQQFKLFASFDHFQICHKTPNTLECEVRVT